MNRCLRRSLIAVVALAVVPSVAVAEPLRPDEITVVKPSGMNDAASLTGRPPWCAAKYTGDVWEKGRLRRATGSRIGDIWFDGAEHICQWADDPTWQKQAQYMVQAMMNEFNVSQADALAKIKDELAKRRVAAANAGREPTDEERFAFHEQSLTPFKPERGVDTPKISGAPAWCDKAQITDKWDSNRISRSVTAKYGITGLIEGALHICQRPNDATWRTEAGYILQQWMNWTKLSQAEAEASLRARIQSAKFQSERDALCKGLEYSAELAGEARTYAQAHRRFFGCEGSLQALWLDQTTTLDNTVGFYLDADDKLESEIVRLYWLFQVTQSPDRHELPAKEAAENRPLLTYAYAQWDFANIDTKAIDKLLTKSPYNDYARIVVNESLGVLKWRRKLFEEAVGKLANGDKDYTAILRDAPKKGFADWDKVTAQWKAEIERSTAFEKKLSLPSRKELAGCAPVLSKDAEKLIRSYKETTYNGVVTKIAGDPVANLLLDRLAVCFAVDKVWGGSGALADLVKKGRDLRGPRSLAYYAIVDAIAATQKDRPRLLLSLSGFSFRMPHLVDVYGGDFTFTGTTLRDAEKDGTTGTVKTITKVPEGDKVVFKTEKVSYPEVNCVETNKPMRILLDGRIEYYQSCTATGKMLFKDVTPKPIVISPALAAGVKPGAFVVAYEAPLIRADGNLGLVIYTKAAAADKKILTFYGFTL